MAGAQQASAREPGNAGLAATFLKHKLWRIRNTGLCGRFPALCLAAQVVDRSTVCAHGIELARLLLVTITGAVSWISQVLHAQMPVIHAQ